MHKVSPIIVWFRQDLRLRDNPALYHAAGQGAVLPVFILDNTGDWAPGAASRVWLHHSLAALNRSMHGHLIFMKGDPAGILPSLAAESGATAVYWNRCYEPQSLAGDKRIEDALRNAKIPHENFQGNLLIEPWDNVKDDRTPYKVFTPFRNKFYRDYHPAPPLPAPQDLSFHKLATGLSLDALGLLPTRTRWDRKFDAHWAYGEDGAQAQLDHFLAQGLKDYDEGRDRPDRDHVSRLSPYLHHGEISVRQVWHDVSRHMIAEGAEQSGMRYLSELAWREFSSHLLHHFPDFPEQPFQPRFQNFAWAKTKANLRHWQNGTTGYPIVDAGMRELWETGYMHNRVRMIVASFLVKDLLIPWQDGERWFWDCLADADLGNNSGNWQWVAGCGADAAPYFRIFNPVGQGKKFDPEGDYVRRWVPEIGRLPAQYIHAPWEAPAGVLDEAGIRLGKDYPYPVVDHDKARLEALDRFKRLQAA